MHPLSKHTTRYNECVDYAAKMTIVLTYFKCEDDWLDERKISKQAYKRLLRKAYQEIKEEYPDKLAISKLVYIVLMTMKVKELQILMRFLNILVK